MPWRPGRTRRQIKAQRKRDAQAARDQVRKLPYCEDCGGRDRLTYQHWQNVSQGGTAAQGGTTLCLQCNIKRYHEEVR